MINGPIRPPSFSQGRWAAMFENEESAMTWLSDEGLAPTGPGVWESPGGAREGYHTRIAGGRFLAAHYPKGV